MAHRVEPYPTSRRASPGGDRSDSRRSPPPPPAHPHPHPHPHAPPHHYAYEMPRDYPGGYMYGPPPHAYGHDSRYAAYAPSPQPFPMQQGYMPYPLSAPLPGQGPSMAGPTGPDGGGGGGPPIQVVHTDDAGTKLSNSVRRRCFNCCTTETSTWRRSNLSPGKVLCNKCGLFERTHSRPRPEQFPHKRGPLAASTLRARSPGPTNAQPTYPHAQYAPPVPAPAPAGAHHDPHAPYMATFTAPPNSTPGASAPNPNSHTQNHNQNGSVSHPGTPKPGTPVPSAGANAAHASRTGTPNGNGHANGSGSPRLSGVGGDAWTSKDSSASGSPDKDHQDGEREARARKRRGEGAEEGEKDREEEA